MIAGRRLFNVPSGFAAIVWPPAIHAQPGGRSHSVGLVLIFMYAGKEDVAAGGVAAFGVDVIDLFRRVASYADKIFRGASPGKVPVEQSTKLQFVINLKTASSLGITVPPLMLARADEVLE